MAIHTLITGANGAGKTLYAVAKVLRPLVGTHLEHEDGTKVDRRIVQGGIRDLCVDHQLMEVPRWEPEKEPSPFCDLKRDPGDPPIEGVVWSMLNWWAWCMPGDVLVIDECQRLFRPMASGRKVPMFIEKLETARHYGVELVYITQHPNLLHSNVRNLIGCHRHVRRIFGMSRTLVYEWDHATNPDRTKDAVVGTFKHDRRAFSLYKSAEVHTKHPKRIPLAAVLGIAALVSLPLVGWRAYAHVTDGFKPAAKAETGDSKLGRAPTSSGAQSAAAAAVAQAKPVQVRGCWATPTRCECIGDGGAPLYFPDDVCRKASSGFAGLVKWAPQDAPLSTNYGASARPADPSASMPLVKG